MFYAKKVGESTKINGTKNEESQELRSLRESSQNERGQELEKPIAC